MVPCLGVNRMPERTCKAPINYAGRDVSVGDRFEVEDKDVNLLLKTGHIDPAEGEEGYVARDMTADEPSEYRTRDMQRKRGGRR